MREKLRREILELQRSDYIVDFLIDQGADFRHQGLQLFDRVAHIAHVLRVESLTAFFDLF